MDVVWTMLFFPYWVSYVFIKTKCVIIFLENINVIVSSWRVQSLSYKKYNMWTGNLAIKISISYLHRKEKMKNFFHRLLKKIFKFTIKMLIHFSAFLTNNKFMFSEWVKTLWIRLISLGVIIRINSENQWMKLTEV